MSSSDRLYIVKSSGIHRKGLFSLKDISKGSRIIQYLGEKVTKKESIKRALNWEADARNNDKGFVYMFELNDNWDIDGLVGDNPARYINHSCDGNCEAVNENNKIWIYSIKDIRKGEEFTYDYGYDIEHFLDHPCKCNSKNCIGYIVREDQRLKVKKILKLKKL